jgi:uncharacterized protein (TIGR00369 family)
MNEEEKIDLQTMLTKLKNETNELPFNCFLGLNYDCFDIEKGCIHFDMKEELIGNRHFKILHSGVIAAILDTEGGFLLLLNNAWPAEVGPADDPFIFRGGTIDLRIDYLRPGKGTHFVASGEILRRGNKVAVVRTELRNEQEELIAVGTGTYLIG